MQCASAATSRLQGHNLLTSTGARLAVSRTRKVEGIEEEDSLTAA